MLGLFGLNIAKLSGLTECRDGVGSWERPFLVSLIDKLIVGICKSIQNFRIQRVVNILSWGWEGLLVGSASLCVCLSIRNFYSKQNNHNKTGGLVRNKHYTNFYFATFPSLEIEI